MVVLLIIAYQCCQHHDICFLCRQKYLHHNFYQKRKKHCGQVQGLSMKKSQ